MCAPTPYSLLLVTVRRGIIVFRQLLGMNNSYVFVVRSMMTRFLAAKAFFTFGWRCGELAFPAADPLRLSAGRALPNRRKF
jgi:hypothetical protein